MEMASASPICLMARATSTKSWLWHQRLSHLNFDTINDLAKNDLVTGLPKSYHKEHLCSSCEQGKSKRASHPPKPVPNSKQSAITLFTLGYIFLRSKDEAPENDREDIGKLGAKADIGFFIGYSATSCAYRGYRYTGFGYTKGDSGIELTGFSDADYAGCKDTFKSTSGGAQFLGEKLVSWSSKKQDCTALSTAEAEYVSLSVCCAQVLWMRTQLTDYGFHFNKIPIYCDSKSAIAISCNPVQHSRTKTHRCRSLYRKHVENGTIETVIFVKTDLPTGRPLTKLFQ
ncbi:copia protein [Tanacetum coccineum]|uniref:Copia protein n=1 Tax=Tanacetum coccineum TaxID=301880 RepID=A0ABQ4Z8I6_9ASTR